MIFKPATTAMKLAASKTTKNRVCLALLYSIGACLAATALLISPTAVALEFQCEVPNDTRYLRVDIPGEEHLCEVSVTYLQSGARQVMWHARNDTLFCSARAYELRDKYEDLWDYTCTTMPDRDGIDELSPSQRAILDQRLKLLLESGRQAIPPYTINAVKAVASNPLDNEPSKMAFQYFTEDDDFTEIIDDQSNVWRVNTTISDMAAQIISEQPVSTAMVHSISAEGSLEIHTQLVDSQNTACFGTQVLTPMGSSGIVRARTPHRFVCNTGNAIAEPLSEATPLESETKTQ